jgi:glycosyltransferase involved in cell wall biosynthesis
MANQTDMLVTRLNRSFPVRLVIFVTMAIGRLLPFRNPSGLFFFFPFCHVGGAERVHARIVSCFAPERPWVVFTKKSDNEKFRPFFRDGRTFNLWQFCKYGYPFSIGILAGLINRHRQATVFGSNSLVYYLLLPYLRPEIRTVDLIHAFGAGIEEYSLPQAPRLDGRVVISDTTRHDLQNQYRRDRLPEGLTARISMIGNCVAVPDCCPQKQEQSRLALLYVGRGSEEKRVHLLGRIAAHCHRAALPVDFLLVGEVQGAVAADDRAFCTFRGEVSDESEMGRIYDTADLLLLTSSREGFPLVIMEAMARGVVPITTAVGGIPGQVQNGVNGWLVQDAIDEERLVADFCAVIERMVTDRALLATMSKAAYDHARASFSGEGFCSVWRRVLLGHCPGGE